MRLIEQMRSFGVPNGAVACWWLGQNGYIFKSPQGTLAGVDLYLTNSCASIGVALGLDLERRVPVLVTPEELDIDLFICSHNHGDHTDLETIQALGHKSGMQFIGPHPSCEVFRQYGVDSARILPAWPDCEIPVRDLVIRGTFAMPTDDSDLNHLGYVLQFVNGPSVYLTGDTAYHPLVASAQKYSPGLMITCINAGFNNLSTWQAAQLAAQIRPQAAIPCHYDMFGDNASDPGQFRAALKHLAPEVKYIELEHGKPFVYPVDAK